MFQEFYGFTRVPFSRTIATPDLFPTAGQKELNARLTYLVRERGVGLVTGDIGSGKSTAVRTFAASLDFNRYLVVRLRRRQPDHRYHGPLSRSPGECGV
jgi:type II secretory pathway predicted ATPase ExeA